MFPGPEVKPAISIWLDPDNSHVWQEVLHGAKQVDALASLISEGDVKGDSNVLIVGRRLQPSALMHRNRRLLAVSNDEIAAMCSDRCGVCSKLPERMADPGCFTAPLAFHQSEQLLLFVVRHNIEYAVANLHFTCGVLPKSACNGLRHLRFGLHGFRAAIGWH